ncbi:MULTISPECIES: tol-pal system-associated acyl-CoA thioesterase [Pandoraea]|jgi:acyl-CoA thioester hydrolase|uniref:4-hydroxybenzoyl-CoA thioesterase n=1 Tax=Pandoraea pnomenusa TaxID=93220 RepID=A0A378YYF0_9BURK|nr:MULTISPECIES: tol-pal system-associated acyl-CoA thioesterase [Pandoraea]AHB06680.1 4-hydroxybenzoyl-CoA thioesterase [Pandoraea pnomenusa 3kgm]AIU28996.1 4-hydroxybenzoyl-CoA thioesterase [Pandoraea pnomenusa]MBN9092336.1 tol-pal system-associated acyl-CoA thioesterase [Pandoraea pnomenusa]QDX21093.1 tol-pal system-associated acyl-CoA thioesterase [Pandoraea pnomenusa]SUA81597.1 Acyl-CoA thioester hydrolase YbgC [Pandoraea pnomenusa]
MRGMADFDTCWSIRVYYEDTDAGGVVFYANYLKFFERARTEWLRSLGIEQLELARNTGMMFIVRATALDYLSPARLDDLVVIKSRIERLGGASVDFLQEAWRDTPDGSSELLARGSIKIGCVRADTLRPGKIPAHVRAAMQAATNAAQAETAQAPGRAPRPAAA